jgi:protein-tyrosine phosphatase
LPDGSWIRGRGLRKPVPPGPEPDFGLYLGTRPRDFPWPHEWIDWPDFRLPRDRAQAAERIRALHDRARAGKRVEVACGGGIGRTGTVIACLATLAGHPAAAAVAWTRANYHPRAVETPWQRRWITQFGH